MTELYALLGAHHIKGAPMMPQHQGLVETSHKQMMASLLMLLNELTEMFPQEWTYLIPLVEYLLATAPQGPHGISADDLETAHSVAHSVDDRLAVFCLESGLPESELLCKKFDQFREVYLTHSLWK